MSVEEDKKSLIETLTNQGRHFEARNLAEEELKKSDDLRLQQLYALALSKSGAPQAARDFLEPIQNRNPDDAETAGILGSIYKAMFRKEQNTSFALKSRDTYLKNFNATKDYYTGINAATMSAIAGQAARGRDIAREIIASLSSLPENFWTAATLGEACLLNKEREKSMQHYFRARKLAGTDWGKISSVYNQLWLLNHYAPVPNEILKTFSPPAVVAFAGHMIDSPSRKQPRLPSYMEEKVKESLLSAIQTLNAKIGYCSLACGSDILFAEAMEESGGEVNIWIPFNRADFIETSLRFAGQQWIDRFERLEKKFPVTYLTQEPYGRYDDLFAFLSQVIFGSAVIRANMSFIKPNLLSVLSETDLRQQQGGTRDALSLWPYPERHLNINPDNFIQAGRAVDSPPVIPPHEFEKASDRPVLYVLYADLTGPGSTEQGKFWKSIEEKFDLPIVAPVTFETEPFLIASFRSIKGTQELLGLILKNIAPTQKGHLRISLYASPVFINPTEKKLAQRSHNLLNSFHILLPSGTVYALARYASVLALDVERFTLDYSGVIAPESVTAPVEIYAVSTNGLA